MPVPILDQLDAHPGGAREFVAELIHNGATNVKIADAVSAKFEITAPTRRTVSHWRNYDHKVVALVEQLRRGGEDKPDSSLEVAADAALRRMLMEEPEKLSADQILRIKRELSPAAGDHTQAINDYTPSADRAQASADLFEALDGDPDLAALLADPDVTPEEFVAHLAASPAGNDGAAGDA